MKYFINITTAEELKKEFRRLSIELHPDRNNGNDSEFKTMLAEYQEAQDRINGVFTEFKHTRRPSASVAFRRGMCIIWNGAGCNKTFYAVVSVSADGSRLDLVEVSSRMCEGVEFFKYYDLETIEDYITECRKSYTLNEYHKIEPLSKEFGIGWYYDDTEGAELYTEQEITDFCRRAENIRKYGAIVKAEREEQARKAEEERKAAERKVIKTWRGILEQLPPLHTYKPWDAIKDLPRAERKAQEEADRKASRKANAQRLAAFKRNIKSVFNHYFPGVNVKVSDTSKCWCESSEISWTDGPTVAEVQAIPELYYFIGSGWCAAGPYDDYGHRTTLTEWAEWRELFGAWSADKITFNRTLSEETEEAVNAVICSLIADYKGKEFNDKIDTTDKEAQAVINYFGFNCSMKWRNDMTEEEKKAYWEACNEHEEERKQIRRIISPDFQQWRGECYWQQIHGLFVDFYEMPQSEPKQESKTTRKSNKTTDTTEPTEPRETATGSAPEGLELVNTAEGVEIHETKKGATFKHRKEIRANGGDWDKVNKVWFATDADKVQQLREWFGVADDVNNGQTDNTEQEPEPQSTDSKTTDSTDTDTESKTADTMPEGLAQAFAQFIKTATDTAGTLRHCDLWGESLTTWHGSEMTKAQAEQAEKMLTLLSSGLVCVFITSKGEEYRATPTAHGCTYTTPQGTTEGESLEDVAAMMSAQTTNDPGRKFYTEATQTTTEGETVAEGSNTPQDEPQTATGQKIRFSWDDVPELDELNENGKIRTTDNADNDPHDPTDPTPGSTPTGGAPDDGKGYKKPTREHFAQYAKEAEEATDRNDHTQAVILEATAIITNFDRLYSSASLLRDELRQMSMTHDKRGYIMPEEQARRAEIEGQLIILCVSEYGEDLAAVLFGAGTVKYHLQQSKAA